jgi:hypothetical protein
VNTTFTQHLTPVAACHFGLHRLAAKHNADDVFGTHRFAATGRHDTTGAVRETVNSLR